MTLILAPAAARAAVARAYLGGSASDPAGIAQAYRDLETSKVAAAIDLALRATARPSLEQRRALAARLLNPDEAL